MAYNEIRTINDIQLEDIKARESIGYLQTYVTPQMFGAVGDGVTDDTDAFKELNGKVAYIPEGTYIVSSIVYGSGTKIRGSGIGKTVIKQAQNCNEDMVAFVDAPDSGLCDVLLLGRGNDPNENEDIHTYKLQSLLKIRSYNSDLHGCDFSHIRIMWANNVGMYIGSETGKYPDAKTKNWVYQFDDIRIEYCKEYCLYDESTDNRFSNFYLSEGGKACFFSHGAENMYTNFKIDQPYETYKGSLDYGSVDGERDGAAMIIEGSRSQYVNFDIQSPHLIGLKLYNSFNISFNGNFDNSGYTNLTDGTSIMIKNCVDSKINCIVRMSKNVTASQKYDIKILDKSENISCYVQGGLAENINKNPVNCFITNVCNSEASNYNTVFFVDRQLTNSFQSPLFEDFSNGFSNKTSVEQDNTSKVVGTNSIKFTPTNNIRATFSSRTNGLEPNATYLMACEVVVSSVGDSSATGFYMASATNIYNKYYNINPKTNGRYVCFLIIVSDDNGSILTHFSCDANNMVVYLGNVLLYKLSGNLLDSKLNTDWYEEIYLYLTKNVGTEFGSLVYKEKITNGDIVCAVKRLMGQ